MAQYGLGGGNERVEPLTAIARPKDVSHLEAEANRELGKARKR